MRDIGNVRLAIEGAFDTAVTSDATPTTRGELSRRALAWTLVGLIVRMTGLSLWSVMRSPPSDATVSR